MDHQRIFSELVKKHFAYLCNEFGFSLVEDQYHQRWFSCVVAFQNTKRYVELMWELKDQFLSFGVYRTVSDGMPAPYNDDSVDNFYIFSLAEHYKPRIDAKWLTEMTHYNPDLNVLDEKIRVNAQLLEQYGKDILTGQQWFDHKKNKLILEA